MFLGYLLLKPKYDKLSEDLRQEHYKNFTFSDISRKDAFQSFLERYRKSLDKIIANQIKYENIKSIESFSLDTLITAFELIPSNTENSVHKNFIGTLATVFSKELLKHPNKLDYMLRSRFFEKFSVVVLNSSIDEIKIYIKPFVENFRSANDMSEFFETFVSTEDRLNRYEEFWIIWDLFYDKIVEISADTYYHSTKAIIRRYLLAGLNWNKDAKQWHSLKDREKSFYRKVAFDMGNHPSVLFSLSKLLNEIGSDFLADGIIWISDILQRNKNLFEEELETDTVFYLEKVVRKYVLTNRQEIKTIAQTKKRVTILLDFLIEKGSVMMYLLREEIM